MEISQFYDALWQDFVRLAPQAAAIRGELEALGECVVNDHVAFRTFNIAPLNIESLEPELTALGYRRLDSYRFKSKHLNAWSYISSAQETTAPLIFLSELSVEALSDEAQAIIRQLIDSVPPDVIHDASLPPIFCRGRLWPQIRFDQYSTLLKESEYAAWLALHGYHANHFTVSLNALNQYNQIEPMLAWVESLGFTVNESGGRVKGTPKVLLEQGATMADLVEITFSCGHTQSVPGCFYEFALRYQQSDGNLFMGFVEGNADKIFDSTNRV